MSDEPIQPPTPGDPRPAGGPDEIPDWLRRIRDRRVAEAAARRARAAAPPPPTPSPDAGAVADTPAPAEGIPAWLQDASARPEEAAGEAGPAWLEAALMQKATGQGPQPVSLQASDEPVAAPAMQAAPVVQATAVIGGPATIQEDPAAARARRRRERRARARHASPLLNMIQSLMVVAAAAALIATIFTFWTPASFLSDETREGLRPAYATLSAQSPPTPIPTPIWMRRIGIVSGHWGPHPSTGRSDPGAVCPDGLTEAEVNRNVAQLVVQALSRRGYDVDLLDEWDPRLDGYQASVLLSIHADSCHQFTLPGATGFKVAPPASRTSARADDLRLRDCLLQRYQAVTNMPVHPSITRDMTEYHSFNEISEVTPAGIIELGFLYEDRDLLENRPDLLAEGIVQGLLCFLEQTVPTPLPELTPWPTLESTPTPLPSPGLS
ncbi:MAG: N-acetylmuramoyl-L-alanine amidase [Anaerolineae bacterium]|nr:N-acetylmuramoyl-L-alanine amidase [Anaerolineae bacterium]